MFTLEEAAQICRGTLIGSPRRSPIAGVSIDSRTLEKGMLFVALQGARTDGHQFVRQAFQRGAAGALVSRSISDEGPLVLVGDPLMALQELARWHRSRFSIPVIAVTGSIGKTTTKECIGTALSGTFRIRTGVLNWNNHLGVPLNLLRLKAGDQCLVLELGANHRGEIAMLSELAQPTVGVITGIHPVHLEGFGSVSEVYEAKLELVDYLKRSAGVVVAYGDDEELMRRLNRRGLPLVTFGKKRDVDFSLSELSSADGEIHFKVRHQKHPYEFHLKGYGEFNALNALAAIAAAGTLGVDLKRLSQAWQALPILPGRFQLRHLTGADLLLIDDTYNANPDAFVDALNAFRQTAGCRRKIVVIGDMLELGEQADNYHETLGRDLVRFEIDAAFGIGRFSRLTVRVFSKLKPKCIAHAFENRQEAIESLCGAVHVGDAILIKGSHGMQLEEIVNALIQKFERKSVLV